MRDWESTFRSWAQGPSKTEKDKCDNAIRAIKDAINSSYNLQNLGVEVFLQGSYRNHVNVRQDSDVDIGVVCTSIFYTDYPEGTDNSTFNNNSSSYTLNQFKDEVEIALIDKFGQYSVNRGSKAFDIKSNSYRVEADVTPFFEHRRYDKNGHFIAGVALASDSNGLIVNYPEQHYKNGVNKNTICNRRYKRLVRVLKKLSNEMEQNRIPAAKGLPGFLCECLVWNISNHYFNTSSYVNCLRSCLFYLYEQLGKSDSNNWGEVSDLNYLFHSSQKWTKQQTKDFVIAVWNYVGFK